MILRHCDQAILLPMTSGDYFIGVKISALGETETSREWMTCMANLTSVEILNVNKFLFFDDKKRAAASLLLQKYVIRKSFSLQVGDSFQIARTVEVYFLEL